MKMDLQEIVQEWFNSYSYSKNAKQVNFCYFNFFLPKIEICWENFN
jgi:hypothetical protein